MTEKFTPDDRNLVIKELEKIQQSKLRPIKPSKKLFIDDKGMYYVIFGGKNDWHGIRPNLFQQLREYNKEGALVVAKKYQSKIDLCVGSLSELIKNQDKLVKTKNGDLQFHNILTEDGLYVKEIPELYLNRVSEIFYANRAKNLSRLKAVSKIINIEVQDAEHVSHSDIQAKLILIGSYLGYRTYTPDKSKNSVYGNLGELCSDTEIPEDYIPPKQIETIKFIDVIWFDEEGFPTHAFEVEHSTDITKGLLRLYQVNKLKIKMFIIADENNRVKFEREVIKNPFHKVKEEYIFKNYSELDEFFDSVKNFTRLQKQFLNEVKV
ncbi:MAG: hypothetical protein ACE5JB_15715 [bacterium]